MITEVEVAGETLEVEYEFTRGEEQEYDYPGSPDRVEIQHLTLCGVNIWNLIDPLYIDEIENDIINQHKQY